MSTLTAEAWNERYPVGTPVTAYPGLRPEHPAFAEFRSKRLETRTRSAAWNLGHGEPVVLVDDYAGGISLEHIDLRTEEAPMSQPQPVAECANCNGYDSSTCLNCRGTGEQAAGTPVLDLDAIQARLNAATPGPWYADGSEIYAGDPDMHTLHAPWVGETCNVDLPDHGEGNATFVAAARTDVEQFLARVRQLEAELRRERAAHSSTIDERDRATDCADRLAAIVAPIDVRGEHSIGNCPWEAALHYAAEQAMTPRERANAHCRALLAAGDAEGAVAYAEAYEASEAYEVTHPRL
ncbi:hypothetical protein [Kitasatospora sp. NPDC001683]